MITGIRSIGIDPSLKCTAVVMIDENLVVSGLFLVEPPRQKDTKHRAGRIYNQLSSLLSAMIRRVDPRIPILIGQEAPMIGRKANQVEAGIIKGVVQTGVLNAVNPDAWYEFPSTTWKKIILGSANSLGTSKFKAKNPAAYCQLIYDMIEERFDTQHGIRVRDTITDYSSTDYADAFAIALTALVVWQIREGHIKWMDLPHSIREAMVNEKVRKRKKLSHSQLNSFTHVKRLRVLRTF